MRKPSAKTKTPDLQVQTLRSSLDTEQTTGSPVLREVQEQVVEQKEEIPYGYCRCGCGRKTAISQVNCLKFGYVIGQPRGYVRGHSGKKRIQPYRIEDRGYKTPCWISGYTPNYQGYTSICIKGKMRKHHIVEYEKIFGVIAKGLQLDHLCRVRNCVNPDHLEPVTSAVNTQRGKLTKLTRDTVEEIRIMGIWGIDQRAIARKYGISQTNVGRIIRHETWR